MKLIDRLKTPRTIELVHRARAFAATTLAGWPAKKLYVIGITGTKGKTTTSHFVTAILEAGGQRVGRTSTVDFRIAGKTYANNTNKTVLPPSQLQPVLKEMVKQRCRYAVIETSSHALEQYRVWGIPFKIAVFTNLTHDHLDYHGSFDNYRQAKMKLFRWPGLEAAIVNGEDAAAPHFADETTAPELIMYTTSRTLAKTKHRAQVVRALNISLNPGGSTFRLEHELGSVQVKLKLPGLFNIQNALAAASVGLALNMKLGTIKEGLESVAQVPGRMERIETKKGFSVIIDYAHTPDSLEQILKTLRPIVRGKLISVFGCTGDRDRTKRPIMGAIAARYADLVYLTDEEPYTEEPQSIIDEIAEGVPRGRAAFVGKKKPPTDKSKKPEMVVHDIHKFLKREHQGDGENEWWWRILDRREAISTAIDQASFDDVIVITGMGAQNYKIVGHEQVPWNERKIIEEILRDKKLL